MYLIAIGIFTLIARQLSSSLRGKHPGCGAKGLSGCQLHAEIARM
jgi:hypothetical protein